MHESAEEKSNKLLTAMGDHIYNKFVQMGVP